VALVCVAWSNGIIGCLRVRADGCADYSVHQHTDELIPFRGHTNQHTDEPTNQHTNDPTNQHTNTSTDTDAHAAHAHAHDYTDACAAAQALDERRLLRAAVLVARLKASAVH